MSTEALGEGRHRKMPIRRRIRSPSTTRTSLSSFALSYAAAEPISRHALKRSLGIRESRPCVMPVIVRFLLFANGRRGRDGQLRPFSAACRRAVNSQLRHGVARSPVSSAPRSVARLLPGRDQVRSGRDRDQRSYAPPRKRVTRPSTGASRVLMLANLGPALRCSIRWRSTADTALGNTT
jgi:hypothetical protein